MTFDWTQIAELVISYFLKNSHILGASLDDHQEGLSAHLAASGMDMTTILKVIAVVQKHFNELLSFIADVKAAFAS